MTTITEVLDQPDGKTPRGVEVYFQLAGTDGVPIAGFVGTTSIVGKVSPKVNGAGAYTIDLTGNDDITPSGTRWKRTVKLPSGPNPDPEYLDVPTTGGPYRVDEVLDEAPASVASSALSQEVATRTAQVAALQASLDALTSGADPSLDTFLEAYNRFLSDESAASALTQTVAGKVDKATLTTDGDLLTREGGVPAPITRADLAADPAFLETFAPFDWEVIISGTAATGVNVIPPGFRVPKAFTLTALYLRVGTAPTGASLTVNIVRSGVTIATASILSGATSGSSTGLSVELAAGDIVTVDITSIGSTVAGADLAVQLVGP